MRRELFENYFGQLSHLNCFSPVCVYECVVKFDLIQNDFEQSYV
jgi:hypothetical protein